jgi:hypothetical protein
MKLINRTVKSLAREGYVLLHKKGFRISLNPKVLSEVRGIV